MSINDASITSSSFLNASSQGAPKARPILSRSYSTIYIYKNDPKVVNKGVNVSNVNQAQGGYLPLLADSNYKDRKHNNLSYSYDAKKDHGSRPMHRTTFKMSYSGQANFITKSRIVIIFTNKRFQHCLI